MALAEEISHPDSIGIARVFSAFIHQERGEIQEVLNQAEAIMQLAEERDMATTAVWGKAVLGLGLAKSGRPADGVALLQESLAAQEAAGSQIARPLFLAMFADALAEAGRVDDALGAVAQALSVSEANSDCYFDAELERMKGVLLLRQVESPDASLSGAVLLGEFAARAIQQAEECFVRAMFIAGEQDSKSLELRAAVSLSRLWIHQGRASAVSDLLRPLYSWFTEGLETKDLVEAEKILAQQS